MDGSETVCPCSGDDTWISSLEFLVTIKAKKAFQSFLSYKL